MNKLTLNLLILLTIPCILYGRNFNVMDFGARGNGISDDAIAIQKAVDACTNAGGGDVVFSANHTFLSGPVQLKSNVNIVLETNSVWKANPDESIYHLSAFGKNEGEGMMWIWAKDVENLSFSGYGTIHGNGIKFMGAELFDSYGINLINNLKIRNGDGIDIDHSKNVRIANCHITSGDDAICLKNRREFEEYGSCHDIVVTNCVMESRSCTVKIGSENMDSIYNVVIDNCVIKGSNRGLGIQNRDEGTVSNVVFSNIILDCQLWSDVWWGKAEPIYVTSYPRANGNHKDANWRFPKGQTVGRCGEVSHIYFNHIYATSENGCFIGGDTRDKVNNIYLSNVHLNLKKLTGYDGGVYDKRPCRGEGFIYNKVYGVYVENARDVEIDDLRVQVGPKVNYGGKTFGIDD